MQINEIYERYSVDGSVWVHERRKIISINTAHVCYELLIPEDIGTTTAEVAERIIKQIKRKDWNYWVKLARLETAS
jgi:hypothetical protein